MKKLISGNFELLDVDGYDGNTITKSAEFYDLETPDTSCAIAPSVLSSGFEGLSGGR